MAYSWFWCAACALGVAALLAACASSDTRKPEMTPTFCDVAPILKSKCQRCHQDPPLHSAPFPLVTYADTQADAATASAPSRKRYEQMRVVIENDIMPDRSQSLDPPVSPLSCEEKETLLTWLRKGAPPAPDGEDECESGSAELLSCP